MEVGRSVEIYGCMHTNIQPTHTHLETLELKESDSVVKY